MDDTETEAAFPIGGFVLVGGQSRRMGRNKALLELNRKAIGVRAAELIEPLVAKVALLGSPALYSPLGLRVIPDQISNRGPLAALCTGLAHSSYDWNLFLACDLPLMERGVLEALIVRAVKGHAEAVVPRIGDRWQPLCAVYHRSCLNKMEAALRENKSSVVGVFPLLRLEAVFGQQLGDNPFCERVFRNVNTPQEWLETQRLLGKQNG